MCLSPAKCLLILLFLFPGIIGLAQTTASSGTNTSNPLTGQENDPYSKYGIGELMNGNSVMLRGMANATSAYESPFELNTDNPASYSFLQLTTFEIGMMASTRVVTGNVNGINADYTTGTTTITYLQLGMPVSKSKNAGICFGFKPISHMYYNLVDTNYNSPIGQVINSYNGTGGLNYAYLGGAGKYKGLSLGINLGYLFGTFRKTTAVIPNDTNAINRSNTTQYTNYTRIGGLYWKGGAMYLCKLDSTHTLHIGGTFTMKQNITEHLDAFQISSYNFGDTLVNDTSASSVNGKGLLKMPMSYSIGVMLSKNDKWNLSIDYSATNWGGFQSTPDTTMNLAVGSKSSRISIGGEITPNITDIRSYSARITYRLGFYYGNDYLTINGTSLPEYGFTAGLSLPVRKSTSHLHTSLDIGRLGVNSNNLLQETYVRFSLGISFNQQWFIPRKYD